MQRRRVLFPEPLGPITATTSPEATSRLTLRRISCGPKDLCSPSTRSKGGAGPAEPSAAAGSMLGTFCKAKGDGEVWGSWYTSRVSRNRGGVEAGRELRQPVAVVGGGR